MINLKHTIVYKEFVNRIAGKLRAFRAAAVGLIIFTLFSCSKPPLEYSTCVTGDCFAEFSIDGAKDSNGFYHVKLDYDGEYDPRFTINAVASAISEEYRYNNTSAVAARFEGDKSITIQVAEHLNYTEVVPIVQETQVYFSGTSDRLTTKRIVGPVTRELKGDTLNVKVGIYWDAGIKSISKNFSLKIVLE